MNVVWVKGWLLLVIGFAAAAFAGTWLGLYWALRLFG